MSNILLQIFVPGVLVVLGIVSLYNGIRDIRILTTKGSSKIWYKHPNILIGVTAFFIAFMLLLDDARNFIASQHNIPLSILVTVAEGLFLLFAIISCIFTFRYLLFVRRTETRR